MSQHVAPAVHPEFLAASGITIQFQYLVCEVFPILRFDTDSPARRHHEFGALPFHSQDNWFFYLRGAYVTYLYTAIRSIIGSNCSTRLSGLLGLWGLRVA